MHLLTSRLAGDGIIRAPDLLRARLASAHMIRTELTVIVAADDFSWRTTSGLMVVVVFVFDPSKATAEVSYLSGGGGQGVFALDWGSEVSKARKLVEVLLEICRSEGWSLTAE